VFNGRFALEESIRGAPRSRLEEKGEAQTTGYQLPRQVECGKKIEVATDEYIMGK